MSDVDKEHTEAVGETTEAKDIKACVGMWRWRAFAFVGSGSCPLGRDHCFQMSFGAKPIKDVCPHFCEVETIDWLCAVKCDHPQTVASYG